MRELAPASCPVISTHVPTHMCIHPPTNKEREIHINLKAASFKPVPRSHILRVHQDQHLQFLKWERLQESFASTFSMTLLFIA